MTDRNDRAERGPEPRPAEGVRIIRAEEAQAALEAGAAAGRRPDDELRFGDVPPTPSGPRPAHRFPLPTSVDPAEVPHPPVAAPGRGGRTSDAEQADDEDPSTGSGSTDAGVSGVVPGRLDAVRHADPAGAKDLGEQAGTPEPVPMSLDAEGAAEHPADLWSEVDDDYADPFADRGGDAADPPTGILHPPGEGGADRSGIERTEKGVAIPAAGAWLLPAPSFPAGVASAETPSAGTPVVPGAAEPWAPPIATPPIATPPVTATPAASPFTGSSPAASPAGAAPTSATPPAEATPPPAPWAPPAPWEPPPAWEPAPPSARVPAWDSPLDAAEGISPAPSSWTPPEAWAESSKIAPSTPSYARPVFAGGVAATVGGREVPRASIGGSGPEGNDTSDLPSTPAPAGSSELASEPATAPPSEPGTAPPGSSNEGITVTGGFGTDLPHWTDPPTGEVPRLRPDEVEGEDPDEVEAWKSAGQDSGVRWRDDANDWNDIGGLDELGSEETRVGALDTSRPEQSDLYSFDEDFERLDEERSGQHRLYDEDEADPAQVGAPERVSSAPRASGGARMAPRSPRGRASMSNDPGGPAGSDRDLGSAVAVGVGLIVLLVIGYAVGSKGLLVLSAAVVLACGVEAFAMVQRRGFKPATLLGLAGAVGVVFGAYWRGTEALSIITAIVFVAAMLWYLLGVVDARPLANVSATLMVYLWVGFLGSFAALLLRAPHGRGLFLGAVLPTVAADVVAYIVGSQIGSRTLAPGISPSKTVEGVIAGGLAALVVGAIIGSQVTPWGGIKHGLLLGLVIAVVAPIGDLFESMIKRDLAVKDSGSTLPGHGGLLDRFDSMLVVLPAAYYLASLFNLHV